MGYYGVKLNWLQPKEGTDEMERKNKVFLVYAESVTEAEGIMVDWTPSNYQDAIVSEVKKMNIGELKLEGGIETFFVVKVMDDLDGRAKPKPYFVVYDGNHLEDAVRKASADWKGAELEEVKKFKLVVDEDLISEEMPVKKVQQDTV